MFFESANGMCPAPLTYNPFKALVAPRPIGWISTVSRDGVRNLAPFSYFNGISDDPPMVVFAPNSNAGGVYKDTFANILQVPEFVVNVASWELRLAMNQTSKSYPPEVDEFDEAGLTAVDSVLVRPPRAAEARAALECTVFQVIELPTTQDGYARNLVIGNVVGIYIDDDVIVDGLVDATRLNQLARLGYSNYSAIESVFEMHRPK